MQDRVGLIDDTYQCSFDYDWFLRLTSICRSFHVNRAWGGLRLHSATKTSNQASIFTEENQRILTGRELPNWKRQFYVLRRLATMLSRGEFRYVLRGAIRRFGKV